MKAIKKSSSHNTKEKQVKELAEKIKKSRTLMIVSVKSLPSKQFQEIKKSIRQHAYIRVAKKNIMLRAIKEVGKESIFPLNNHIKENCAFAISEVEGFELAGIFLSKKTPVFAKAGQIAPNDIEVKDGPTSLVPGPAISELGALGIQISVEGGKIAIKKAKIIVKAGEPITADVCALLQKLSIQPFSIGLKPVAIYDVKTEKIYSEIKIDPEESSKELIAAARKSLGFAQKIGYFCKETILYFLARANMETKALDTKINSSKEGGN